MPNKPKEYGSPLGAPTPSTQRDAGRPKAKDPDPAVVREAMKKASTQVPDFTKPAASKPVRGSSSAPSKRQRVLRRTEEEIEKQSQ
jgi:hypothetical protein